MESLTEEQYQSKIRELEKEVKKLNLIIQKDSKIKYGLRWIDVPEAFEKESENKIPILEKVKENAIKNDDGKPTHILIEGDNYHALKCLNYTHKGKIDVIYIDPPYNTGSDGFTYKDKRYLSQFPDGTTIPKEHPLRHSTWLSFMSKRLELAKNLLSEKGVIFISIDDNEQANLKLLCDQIFGEENFVANFIWRKKTGGGQTTEHFAVEHEYILCYAKNTKAFSVNYEKISYDEKLFNKKINGQDAYIMKLEMWGTAPYREDRPSLYYPIKDPNGKDFYPKAPDGRDGRWRKKPEKLDAEHIYWQKSKGVLVPYEVTYKKDVENSFKTIMPRTILYDLVENTDATKEIISIFGKRDAFAYSKPRLLIQKLLQYASPSNNTPNNNGKSLVSDETANAVSKNTEGKSLDFPNPCGNSSPLSTDNCKLTTPNPYSLAPAPSFTVLDFFAGSGTTLHATMKLNSEDGGNRQCILVQQKEKDNNICQNITYERNRRVMQGYTNSKGEQIAGLGNSLKYYRTAFVGENEAEYATDKDKIALSKKAGCLLSMAENTLEEYVSTDRYQIFGNDKNSFTGIYFSANADKIHEFATKLEQLRNLSPLNSISAYFFTSGDGSEFSDEFESLKNIKIKSIPEPILEVYRRLN